MEIHSLQELDQALRNGMVLAIDDGTVTSKVDVTTIEKHAIETYAGSTLAGAAQSVQAALNGLMQKSLSTEIAPRTAIASGDDLNTYTTAGIYRCATATIAASLSNCPVSNVGFNLDVVELYNVAFAYQRITASSGTTTAAVVEVYERFINVRDSMYGTWKKVPTRAEVDALSSKLTVNGVLRLSESASAKPLTLTVPSTSRHLLILTGPYVSRGHAVYTVACNASGSCYAYLIGGGDDMSQKVSGTGNTLTITSTSESDVVVAVADLVISGNQMTIAS